MAGTYDSEHQRVIDRIKCIAFREARDAGAEFINRNWIANKVNRSVRWVAEWWQKSESECFGDYSNVGRPLLFSRKSENYQKCKLQAKEKFIGGGKRDIADEGQRSLKTNGLELSPT
jgi:hypothetical protein